MFRSHPSHTAIVLIASLFTLLMYPACEPWNLEPQFPEVITGSFEKDPLLPNLTFLGEIRQLSGQTLVEEHGHIWSQGQGTTLSLENHDGISALGQKGAGLFESNALELTPSKTFSYRAYALHEGKPEYGEIQIATTTSFVPQFAVDSIEKKQNENVALIQSSISGLISDMHIQSYGLTWGPNPSPNIDLDQVAPEQGIIVSETNIQFSSRISLDVVKTYMRLYLVVGDTTYYGDDQEILSSNIWTRRTDFGGGQRREPVSFSIANKGYAGLGAGESMQTDFWEYDPQHDVWTQLADFAGVGRTFLVGFSIGEKGYVGTGASSTVIDSSYWQYDPQANTWTQLAGFIGGPRLYATGFSIGNKGYMGTGYGLRSDGWFRAGSDFWEYDPEEDTWTQCADYGGGEVHSAVGFSIGNKGYMGTGREGSGLYRKDFWEYDPQTDSWTQGRDYPGGLVQHAVGFSIGSKGYMGTGGTIAGSKSDFWEYDPQTDTWIERAPYGGGPMSGGMGFSIGNKGYIGVGTNGDLQQDFWEYTPD